MTMTKTTEDTPKPKKRATKPRSEAQKEQFRKMQEKGKATRFKAGGKQAETARKGGKASGKAKQEKKNMQEWARYLLDLPLHDGDVMEEGSSLASFTDQNTTVRARIMKNLVTKASNGDLHAIGMLSDLAGESPIPEVHVEVRDTSKMTLEELIEYRKALKEGKVLAPARDIEGKDRT